MTKGEAIAKFKHLSPKERRAFDRWLQGCAVVGSILGIGLVAMAVAGSRTPGPVTAPASTRTQATSFQEQHGLAHLEYLPIDQFENHALVFSVTNRGADSSSDSSVHSTENR